MENGRMMFLHSIIIGLVLYFIMTLVLRQTPVVAEKPQHIACCVCIDLHDFIWSRFTNGYKQESILIIIYNKYFYKSTYSIFFNTFYKSILS